MKNKKESLMEIKDLAMKDWRGILATLIIVGGFLLIAYASSFQNERILPLVISALSPVILLTVEWYFRRKGANDNG